MWEYVIFIQKQFSYKNNLKKKNKVYTKMFTVVNLTFTKSVQNDSMSHNKVSVFLK